MCVEVSLVHVSIDNGESMDKICKIYDIWERRNGGGKREREREEERGRQTDREILHLCMFIKD